MTMIATMVTVRANMIIIEVFILILNLRAVLKLEHLCSPTTEELKEQVRKPNKFKVLPLA